MTGTLEALDPAVGAVFKAYDIRGLVPAELTPARPHGRFRMTPRKMDRAPLTAEQVEVTQAIALSIFADMSNNGFSLREALAAVYLSGLNHGATSASSGGA